MIQRTTTALILVMTAALIGGTPSTALVPAFAQTPEDGAAIIADLCEQLGLPASLCDDEEDNGEDDNGDEAGQTVTTEADQTEDQSSTQQINPVQTSEAQNVINTEDSDDENTAKAKSRNGPATASADETITQTTTLDANQVLLDPDNTNVQAGGADSVSKRAANVDFGFNFESIQEASPPAQPEPTIPLGLTGLMG